MQCGLFVDRMKTKVDQNDNTTIAFESRSLTHTRRIEWKVFAIWQMDLHDRRHFQFEKPVINGFFLIVVASSIVL